jgi:hypothetical protein
MVVDAPSTWLTKVRLLVPIVIEKKITSLIEILRNLSKNLSIKVNNIESFIKLKKCCEICLKKKQEIQDFNMEINDFIEITLKKENRIKLEDYNLKFVNKLGEFNLEFERKYESISYYVDNNISNFRNELTQNIKKFDEDVKSMNTQLNDDKINIYSNNSEIPLIQLENLENQINKVNKSKTIYIEQMKDLEMEENEIAFSNLDNLTYDYNLKCKLWKSISEFHKTINSLEKLYELNTKQYNKLEQLELVYEKYKYQNILNPQKTFEISQKIGDLTNFFEQVKSNKDKLTYLLHNSGMTDSNVIKIKHSKKMELIKTLKLCCNKNNPMIDMIELYENMHENTLNKLKEKINETENKINDLIKQMNELQNIN